MFPVDGDHKALLHQGVLDHPRHGEPLGKDEKIEVVALHLLLRVLGIDGQLADADVRIFLAVGQNGLLEEALVDGAQHQGIGLRGAEVLHGPLPVFDEEQGGGDILVEGLPAAVEADISAHPVEEGDPQFFFQAVQAGAQGGLGDV